MASPKFSIVIPTRNRAATLKWSLRTCLDADYQNFEVVVSDNYSSDDTAAVVEACGDPRIRYVKTPAYLSMARNFENGLRHATGDFVLFIGDDDGVMPFALRVLEAMFEKHPEVDAIDWLLHGFLWPQAPRARLNLNWISNFRGIEVETAEQAWTRVNHPRSNDFNDLNAFNLYHGCFRRRVFDAAAKAGVSLLASPIPDVAAAIRALRFARRKLRLDVSMTVNGVSRMSNGYAHLALAPGEQQQQIRSEFHAMAAADFPGAALVDYAWIRPNCFLGPLMDEHMDRRSDLTELDLEPWRAIYFDFLVRLPLDDLKATLPEVNAVMAGAEARGARNARPLSESDVNRYRPSAMRIPRSYGLPFRFSDTAVAAARAAGIAPRRIDDPRLVSMTQTDREIEMQADTGGSDLTVRDFVQLTASLMRCDPFDPAKLIAEDPALFRSRVVLNVLGHLAADAA